MSRKQYISQLKKSIENLSKWESSGKAFGHLENLKKKNKPDRLYEFYCYIRIIEDLRNKYDVELIESTNGKIFPQAPASKKGWAKFILRDQKTGNILFQVCFGTNIKISKSPKTTFAADISFQKPDATEDPEEKDVVLIMDAKYKTKNTTPLEINIIREFAKCIDDFGVLNSDTIELNFNKLKDLKGNCLLTNDNAIEDHRQYCKNNKLKQVEGFDCDGRIYKIVG